MKKNRSVPPCTVIPQLYYPDPRQAADWLCKAFGFKERLRIGENHRVQMKAGDGCLVVAEAEVLSSGFVSTTSSSKGLSDKPLNPETQPAIQAEWKAAGGHGVMVRIDDADAHCERARAAGAKILTEPTTHMYGERQYNAEDPWGHHWDFTQTVRDVDPMEWGGEAVALEG